MSYSGTLTWSAGGQNVVNTKVRPTVTTEYTVTASMEGCPDVSDRLRIEVGDSLYLAPPSLPAYGSSGTYSQLLELLPGAVADFSIVEGNLPVGFGMNSAGLISGTFAGDNAPAIFTVAARDRTSGCSVAHEYILAYEDGAYFTIDGISYQTFNGQTVCLDELEIKTVMFKDPEPDYPRWHIDGVEKTEFEGALQFNLNLSAGTHEVRMTHRRESGATDVLKTSFTLSAPQTLDTGDTAVCAGNSVELKINSPSPDLVYLWYADPQYHNLIKQGASLQVDVPDRDTAFYVESISSSGCNARKKVNVSIASPPSVTAPDDFFLCFGQDTTLTVLSSDGELTWSIGNTNVGNTKVRPAVTTEYTVTATRKGCPDASAKLKIEVGDSLHITHDPHDALPEYENSKPYTLQLSSNAQSPEYSVTGGKLPEGLSLSTSGHISGTPSGNESSATFTVGIADSRGCGTSREFTLLSEMESAFYVNGIRHDLLNGTDLCADSASIRATTKREPAAGADSFKWFFDGVEDSAAEGAKEFKRPLPSGTHTVEMTVKDAAGKTDTLKTSFTSVTPPTVVAPDDFFLCYGRDTTLSVLSSDGELTWSVETLRVKPAVTAEYTVTASRTGCPDASDKLRIEVGDSLYISSPGMPVYKTDEPYSFRLSAPAGVTHEIIEGQLPQGLSMDESGLISGIPSGGESFSKFTVLVKDSNGCSVGREFVLVRATEADLKINGVLASAGYEPELCNGQVELELLVARTPSALKWFIDGTETTEARNRLQWTVELSEGTHRIMAATETPSGETDSITASLVVLNPEPATSDTVICSGNDLTLQIRNASERFVYRWYLDAGHLHLAGEGTSFELKAPTADTVLYIESESGGGCTATKQINILVATPPRILAPDSLYLCHGSEITLYVDEHEGELSWNTETLTVSPARTSEYIVKATVEHCPDVYDTIVVAVVEPLYLLPETLPNHRDGENYSETFVSNAVLPEFTVTEGTLPDGLNLLPSGLLSGIPADLRLSVTFTVEVRDIRNCTATKEYTLNKFYRVPKVFTPNGDGVNDVFMSGSKLIIFDRLGKEIHRGDNGWDGTYKGTVVPCDIYFYKLTRMFPDNVSEIITGYVGVEY
jgi:gliding motility-associated-like protein